MNILYEEIPLLARHAGVWEGTYTHLRPDWSVLDRHAFRIRVELPPEGEIVYRQHTHYWWPDGATQDLVFGARYADKRIWWHTDRIRGALWALDELTLYLTFTFGSDPGSYVCEMIQLSPDGEHRARTWHWFESHQLAKLTLVDERRIERTPPPR